MKHVTIAFASGAAVMAFEILSARVIAPVFGQSLFVWATVIATTLGALAIGYTIGGRLIDRCPTQRTLTVLVLVSSALMAALPVMAAPILTATDGLGFHVGMVLGATLLLGPPLIMLGMLNPALVRLAARSVERLGTTTGTLYAISTAGGVLATLTCGLWLLPELGVRMTALVFAFGLAATTTIPSRPNR